MSQPSAAAERQRRYRRAHTTDLRRLDMWIGLSEFLAIERLARHHGTSRRAVIESLIRAADEAAVSQVPMEDQYDYYGTNKQRVSGKRAAGS